MSPVKQKRIDPALVGGLGLSLLLHVALLAPSLVMVLKTPGAAPQLQEHLAVEHSPQNEPRLGLDAPNPSSLTWVGYEQYQEHIAALAEFDQAAFTQHPGDLQPEMTAAQQQHPLEPNQQDLSESAQQLQSPPTQPLHQPQIDPAPSPLASKPEHVSDPIQIIILQPIPEPHHTPQGDLLRVRALFQQLQQLPMPAETGHPDQAAPSSAHAPSEDAVTDDPAAPHTPDHSPAPATQPQQPSETQNPAQGSIPGDTPKPPSDKESDAFSIIDADAKNWRDGQPLAAQGIEIKPQKPHFTVLQRVTQSPGNPLVMIRFGPDGVPVSAQVVQSSGSASVDASIEASLYRWRATGAAIEEIADDNTFDITIRIVLNPRAAAEQAARDQQQQNQHE